MQLLLSHLAQVHSSTLESQYLTPMTRLLAHLALAFAVFAALVFGTQLSQGPELAQATAEPDLILASEDLSAVDVSLKTTDLPLDIAFGSRSLVHRFELEAEAPYSLRYLVLHVEEGSLDPTALRVYPEVDGEVDFSQELGRGVRAEGPWIRVLMEAEEGLPYLGQVGRSRFVVTAPVTEPISGVQLASEGAPFDWAWIPGATERPWFFVEESLGWEALIRPKQ